MYIDSYLNTAELIVSSYGGKIPFAPWLRDFFRQDKKYGSRDRRIISHLCYSYFRLGGAFVDYSIKDRLRLAQFLTTPAPSPVLEAIDKEWNARAGERVEAKLAYLNAPGELEAIFPLLPELSKEINPSAFAASHLLQPDLHLRIRPGYEKKVIQKLEEAGVGYQLPAPGCLALDNGTKADQLFELDREVVVQDLNSQQVIQPLVEVLPERADSLSAWDCCAASGGKSLLLKDNFPAVRLTVSDVRQSILVNLKVRFERAGIKGYESFVGDVGAPGFSLSQNFDLVLCDAPCSGSGTWSRTPEQLPFFKNSQIDHYSRLQRSIALNAGRQVAKGGHFLYITCSVFAKENEEVVHYLKKNTALQLLTMRYFTGYDKKADTLFAALFRL